MESIIAVLRLFSCFFPRAPAAFPSGSGAHQTVGSSLLRPWHPGQEEVTQEILDCLSLEVRTEEGKQMMTTEKQPLGRAEGSVELWGWVAEKPHWGNADFEATSLTPGLE